MLITFIVLYLLASIGIGLYAATRVHNTADYAVAGRSLPLAVVIATTFATWFGSETVLGVSARFVDGGLGAVVEDPFGASMCLVLVGLFFAYKLYKKNLITLGDYYRQRYGRVIEVACSAIIMFSYLGWVAAQITALGLVFNLLTQGAVSVTLGMVIGTVIDPDMKNQIRVTVVATGLGRPTVRQHQHQQQHSHQAPAVQPQMRVVQQRTRAPLTGADYSGYEKPTVQRQRAVGTLRRRADIGHRQVSSVMTERAVSALPSQLASQPRPPPAPARTRSARNRGVCCLTSPR